MEQFMPLFWLVLAVALGIVEICTAQLVSIWFVIGAFVTAICSATFLREYIFLQVIVFIAVSALTLILTKPAVNKLKRFNKTKTNSDRNIGKTAIVITDIDNTTATGLVEVEGSRWSARSRSGDRILAGTAVLVEEIQGVKLIVTPVANKESED